MLLRRLAATPLPVLLVLPLLLVATSPATAGPDDGAADGAGEAVLDRVLDHVVIVRIRFQRDVETEDHGAVAPDRSGLAERFRFWRMTRILSGYVIRDRRTVVISDAFVRQGAVASLTVAVPGGPEVPGRLHGFLTGVEGCIVRTEQDLAATPLTFQAEASGQATWAASVAEGPEELEVWASDLRHSIRRPLTGGADRLGTGIPRNPTSGLGENDGASSRSIDLVFDQAGVPAGFRFGSELDTDGRWRGRSVLASEVVAFDDVDAMLARPEVLGPLHRLTVTFRSKSRHDRDRDPFSYGTSGQSEQELWALAVAPDLLVVPLRLAEEKVRSILSIRLDDAKPDEPESEVKAAYAGKLEGYHAFLVRVEGATLSCLPQDSAPDAALVPKTGEALLVHRVAQRGGTRRDQIDLDRVVGQGRGYADRRFLTTERGVTEGVFLRSADGKLVGFSAYLDPTDRERKVTSSRSYASRRRPVYPLVGVLFAELGGPRSIGEKADTRVMPQEEVASRRLPWLGVEFDSVDEGIAELLDVSGPTRDGNRGLIVVVVYDGSPAARAGLKKGDLLLGLHRAGQPPLDLEEGSGYSPFYPGMYGGRGAPAPWRKRANALVRLLREWGDGADYELEWYRDGEVRRTALKVETAPPDFSSAPRHFDEEAGLEVRDLTYEVRHVLRLGADATGVVVGRVEPGSSAAQARILANELVLEMNGQPITSAEDFGERLTAARERGAEEVRLVIRRLGKTRLVDLDVQDGGEEEEAPEEGEPEAGEGEE